MKRLTKHELKNRGVTRICHFTQSRNLAHIATHPNGVVSTQALLEDQSLCFTATDKQRYDGYTGHICCSIEYPNAWYLAKAATLEKLFPDWVILLIAPNLLCHSDTLFCARNAAAGRGAHIVTGLVGFESLYAQSVLGAQGQNRLRDAKHLDCSPTDDQAEVLIKASIPLSEIIGVAVKSEQQAKNEIARLKLTGADPQIFQFVIAPTLFDKYNLSRAIRLGQRPTEQNFP